MHIPTIGLEIHAELRTKTKMFCACPNEPDEREPNKNTCPICLGHPGTLPVANEEAIKKVVKVGLALGGTIAKRSHFDRKSYFYPDLPKGYQISQYEEPLVTGGMLKDIRITRIHLEEDTARLVHEDPSTGSGQASSLVDFNRAGVPLMELVTEPDVKNADEAVQFARSLQRILRYIGASNADMEKGHMRVEANISIRKEGAEHGTKVEVKNLNSFRAVKGAIEYELARQEKLLVSGKKVAQETRGWNDATGETESQRSKESAHDYRYFPEPDLPPLNLSEWDLEVLKRELPELPEAKRKRFETEFGLAPEDMEFFVDEPSRADFFEAAASEFKARRPESTYVLLVNYFTSDLQGLLKEKGIALASAKISPEHFAHLVSLVDDGVLSSRLAKDLLREMAETGEDPETLMAHSGTRLIGDAAELETVVKEVINANPKAVEDYKKGKGNALQFLVGQGMAKTKGQASPDVLKALFEKALKN
ncbi:MAG: Asp-tRNA(Asn)/Glu-tRNA(Gln) amidotransferase subunit GatB [Candidatus Jorgensenbacteria bacterium]|nr:Asp-tRNA(Asn)/Glu-tRNA(Gln) amidotransferase subunit GatB [Candidatus Jorgensenbacteria bacterium]